MFFLKIWKRFIAVLKFNFNDTEVVSRLAGEGEYVPGKGYKKIRIIGQKLNKTCNLEEIIFLVLGRNFPYRLANWGYPYFDPKTNIVCFSNNEMKNFWFDHWGLDPKLEA